MNNEKLINKYEKMKANKKRLTSVDLVLKDLRSLDEPEPLPFKLKDVIKRIKGFDDGTKFQWMYGILKELGSDFGSKIFHEAYQQGRFDEGIEAHYEPEKVKIPQFTADWIEHFKKTSDWDLFQAMDYLFEHTITCEWIETKDNQELFARAWIFGYEVEKEKRYLVKMKGISSLFRHLKYNLLTEKWYMGNDTENEEVKKTHTRKEIEDAGFGWVFDCPGIEIKEVE